MKTIIWNGKNITDLKRIVGDTISFITKAMDWDDNNLPKDLKIAVGEKIVPLNGLIVKYDNGTFGVYKKV